MAIREFPLSWVGVYRASGNTYHGSNNPIQVGGSSGYNSYIGVPSAVKDAINTSSTPATLRVKFNVLTSGEFSLGGHRETSNKARGTMPWYRYLGMSPVLSTGWREMNLTNNFMSDYMKGDLHGIVLYGAIGGNYGQAYGITGDSNQAVFVVEGTWNTPPIRPESITSPVSSTVADEVIEVRWTAGSDAETPTNQLRYEVEYYNGSSWGNRTLTGQGVTSLNIDSRNFPETSNARVRVRTFDGELYSTWRTSSIFTISHNKPPLQPSHLSPRGGEVLDRARAHRFTWRHNDDGAQAGYQLQYRMLGQTSWNDTGWIATISEFMDFGADQFIVGDYEWRVKTKDNAGLESPWSDSQRFTAGEKTNAPTFIEPTSGDVVNASELIVRWSSIDQTSYEIELLESGELLWNETGGTNRQTRASQDLENNKTYTVRLRAFSRESGLWSDWTTMTFETQFIAPAIPVVTAESTDEFNTTITVRWESDNPATETPTAFVDVFRREYDRSNEREWTLVASRRSPQGSWIDYTPASDQTYEYKVRAWGLNRTLTDSERVEYSVSFEVSYLQRARSLSDMIELSNATIRDEGIDHFGQSMFFAGRKRPIWEVGEHEERVLKTTFRVYTPEELRNTVNFLKRHETFLYRDNAGRRFYCVVVKPYVRDLPVDGYDISIDLYEVDYIEGE